jgi:tetratricopeptide (TPR) repeat protein
LFHSELSLAKTASKQNAVYRAKREMGRSYVQLKHYAKAIGMFTDCLSLADQDKIWISHDLGKCHLHLKHYDEALDQGRNAVQLADESGDNQWKFNTRILVAQASGLEILM